MTLPSPSPENGYTVDSRYAMTPDLFNGIFGSIHQRLVEREQLEGTFENLIAEGTQAALDLIQVNIAPQIGALQVAIQIAFDNIAIIVEGVAPNSVLLNSQSADFYLNPQNFSTSTTVKAFMAAADQAAARSAIGAASAADISAALAVVGEALDTKASNEDLANGLETKLNLSGGAMDGPLRLPPGAAGAAPLRMPQGTAPETPANGDIWMTTAGLVAHFANQVRTFWHSGNMAVVGQTEAQAGTATTPRAWTAQRIAQAIDALETKPQVGLYTSNFADETNYPIGHPIWVNTPSGAINRNAAAPIRLQSSNGYMVGGSGELLAGGWRARGQRFDGSVQHALFQRTA